MNRTYLSRRAWLRGAGLAVGAAAAPMLGFRRALPALAEETARAGRHVVLLWMNGGPSQLDTFDLKPGHAHGGEFREIATNIPGLRFSEHLPQLAARADRLAILRAMQTKEGDHGRGTYALRTGHPPAGPIRYPAIGAALAKELAADRLATNYVSIAPFRLFNPEAYGPGFLGPAYAPIVVGTGEAVSVGYPGAPAATSELRVDDLAAPPAVAGRAAKRLEFLQAQQDELLAGTAAAAPRAHEAIRRAALSLAESPVAKAFDLSAESAAVRDAYGRGLFGQGCLMARRLIEAGVAVVEVSLGSFAGVGGNWDTHLDNFNVVKRLSAELDAGWATLMNELDDRGLLERTTILWTGEFGRTPQINAQGGRDHYPGAWTSVLAGGGVRGGQAYGRTSADGTTVDEGAVAEGDLLATLCAAAGVDPRTQNASNVGRPIALAEGRVIAEVVS